MRKKEEDGDIEKDRKLDNILPISVVSGRKCLFDLTQVLLVEKQNIYI